MSSFTAPEWVAIIAAIGLQIATILGLILTHLDNRIKTQEQTRQLEFGQSKATAEVSAVLEDGIKSVGLDSSRKLDAVIAAQELSANEGVKVKE